MCIVRLTGGVFASEPIAILDFNIDPTSHERLHAPCSECDVVVASGGQPSTAFPPRRNSGTRRIIPHFRAVMAESLAPPDAELRCIVMLVECFEVHKASQLRAVFTEQRDSVVETP